MLKLNLQKRGRGSISVHNINFNINTTVQCNAVLICTNNIKQNTNSYKNYLYFFTAYLNSNKQETISIGSTGKN